MKPIKALLIFLLCVPFLVFSQHSNSTTIDNAKIKSMIAAYKVDARGPYRDIRWFCEDGTINKPKEPCEGDGVQHARYKEEVVALGVQNHVYLGQILASTDVEVFWDKANYHSRIKQYMLEKYLKSVDDGWINRKAQFYRGAIQAEDEEAWGKAFFIELLANDSYIDKHFYFLRQAIKDVPHAGDDNVAQLMRSQSKAVADAYEPFMKLRIKIHGQPEVSDISKVEEFKRSQGSKLTPGLQKDLDELVKTMERFFEPVQVASLSDYLKDVTNKDIASYFNRFVEGYTNASITETIEASANAMWYIREHMLEESSPQGRLALFDLSLKLELLITKQIAEYPEEDLKSLTDKICYLSMASAASGYTELWEWDQLQVSLSEKGSDEAALEGLQDLLVAARQQLEWGTGKNSAVFGSVVSLYEGFEPLAHGFLDDRIRGSVALYLGNSIGKLGNFITEASSLSNHVLNLNNQSHIHGLNPGYAFGELVVVEGSAENMEVNPNNIYVFGRPPSDLKPVAGILNVSEGNLVSHVQLLARNLGIPNAAVSSANVASFKKHAGEKVFYAVSNSGTVIMKLESDMTDEERKLFSKAEQSHEMITVPVEKIKLDRNTTMSLSEVNAASSGIYCGPKAANLGELKQNFPDHVVNGFVIPFGVFLEHMKQTIPGKEQTYWEYLNSIFANARQMSEQGKSAKTIEAYQLKELAQLRNLIIEMPLTDAFVGNLETSFTSILGGDLGSVPVFLRSDTNMEDLKSFTGAGLNLTLFNVLEKEKIIQGIKTVWASPYTERSFKWRQKYLTNPENVYPSIVVIPGVDNDFSGVMITKGVTSGKTDEITVAFSRGVGGAVDGQVAETWAIASNGSNRLIAPSREPFYNSLPQTGGTEKHVATFEEPILSPDTRRQINLFSKTLVDKMEAQGIQGPYDVELGFKDGKLWLFQVRPFVENKRAKSSTYLESISPIVDMQKTLSLNTKL